MWGMLSSRACAGPAPERLLLGIREPCEPSLELGDPRSQFPDLVLDRRRFHVSGRMRLAHPLLPLGPELYLRSSR